MPKMYGNYPYCFFVISICREPIALTTGVAMRQASTQGKQCSGCCFPCLHPQSFRTRCQFTKNRFLIVMQRRQPALDFYRGKLQALVYDILPSTTAVFSYAIAVFAGAQTVVSLLQTTQIKEGVLGRRQQSLHQHK